MLKRFERFPTADVETQTLFGGTINNFVRGGRLNESGIFGDKLVHGVAQPWDAAQNKFIQSQRDIFRISDGRTRGIHSIGRISN
jgi:hypothetical protein